MAPDLVRAADTFSSLGCAPRRSVREPGLSTGASGRSRISGPLLGPPDGAPSQPRQRPTACGQPRLCAVLRFAANAVKPPPAPSRPARAAYVQPMPDGEPPDSRKGHTSAATPSASPDVTRQYPS